MNYADLERELIEMAIQHSIFMGSSEELITNARHRVNRRLINLFTSVRLYHDQIAHVLSGFYGNNSVLFQQFRKSANDEYDSSLLL